MSELVGPELENQRAMTRRQAVFMGVGAMVGAGIFALLGTAGAIALSAVWLSFLIAGVIAALQGYSFAKLGAKYASKAGLIGYIAAGFGRESRIMSTLSWMVWMSIIIVTTMVVVSFGTYAAAVLSGGAMPPVLVKVMASIIVIAVILLNSLGGAAAVAKAQSLLVRLVILVLLGISLVTIFTANWSFLAPSTYPSLGDIIGSVALTFFAFLGFGMISFTAKDLKNPSDLGPATYIALAIATITYVAIAIGVFGQLTPQQVAAAGPTAIALAVKPVLGLTGYWIVALTAMLSTAGAANANIYAVPSLLSSLASQQILPPVFGAQRGKFSRGLLFTGLLVIIFVWLLDLSAIAALGSAVALVIFTAITIGHLRIRQQTGASPTLLIIGLLALVITLLGFLATTIKTSPMSLVAFLVLLALAIIADVVWRQMKAKRKPLIAH